MLQKIFSDTLTNLIGRFAGKEPDLKLTFHDLALETGTAKAKLDGVVVLDLAFATGNKVGTDLQLPNWLGHVFKLGEVEVSINDRETLKLEVENKKINLDIMDKQFVKKVLSSLGSGRTSLLASLSQLRNVAEELRDEGLTVTISYKSGCAVTIGLNAKPKLSDIVTGTDAIEINNLLKLIELGI